MSIEASQLKCHQHVVGLGAELARVVPVFCRFFLPLLCVPMLVLTGMAQSNSVTSPHSTAYDLDGNGKSDFVWRNRATGEVAIWLMDGSNIARQTFKFARVDEDWEISGVGDLDGDGKADLIWHNSQSGDVAEWLMDGIVVKAHSTLSSVSDPSWQISRVGDLDGDGRADLIWRNSHSGDVAEWLMNGDTVKSWSTLSSGLDPAWQITGIGDLDGDGRADLIWRNSHSGDVAEWLMNGDTVKSWSTISSGLDLNWQMSSVGDLNGDGKADLIWRNSQSGDVAEWLMEGDSIKSRSIIAPGLNLTWQMSSVGDLDGDGKSDLVWRNTNSGELSEWRMDGAAVKSWFNIYPDPAWTGQPFVPIRVDHLEISRFSVTSYRSGARFNYIPSLRLTETGGMSGVSVSSLAFHLNDIGVQGNLPPWNTSKRIEAGTSRDVNDLNFQGYGDPEFEISSAGNSSTVSVIITFVDDVGRTGTIAATADVLLPPNLVDLAWQNATAF